MPKSLRAEVERTPSRSSGDYRWSRVAWLALAFALFALAIPSTSAAQSSVRDAQARAYFDQGVTLFQNAQYERALEAFRAAYDLSHRPQLLYNIGLTEDRLRHDDLALAAFRGFLDQTGPREPRRLEVERRVTVLEASIAERQQLERQTAEAARAASEAAASAQAARHALEVQTTTAPAHVDDTHGNVPIRKKWWFWTTVGVVVAAAVVVPIAVTHDGGGTTYRPGSVGGVTYLLSRSR